MKIDRIGILTGGGDCGGLNAVVRGAALSARRHGIGICVVPNGYAGLYNLEKFDRLVELSSPRLEAVDAVAASIKEFGWRQPIVVDKDGVIVCGHTRWKAAKKLGLKKVPVHVATDLTPAQIKAYRLADNKSAELAEWNMELLPIELADLQAMDVNLELLGFDGLGGFEGRAVAFHDFDIHLDLVILHHCFLPRVIVSYLT